MRTLPRLISAAILLTAWLASAATAFAQNLPDNVDLIRDVEYGKGGDRHLKLHILQPKTPLKGRSRSSSGFTAAVERPAAGKAASPA
jgi:hypothetical protein